MARAAAEALRLPGAIVLVGERAAEVPGAAHRGGPAGLDHRRPARLGAAAGRRARRGRGRRAADPAARRPAGRPTPAPATRSSGSGAGCCRPRRAGTPPGSWPRPPTASCPRCVVGGVDLGRPARPGGRPRGARPGRVRGQPGDPAVVGDRPGRRGAAGRAGGGEGRARTWTGRAARARSRRPSARHRGAAGRPGAARAGRRDGRRPRPARRSRRPGPSWPGSAPPGGPARPTRRCARRRRPSRAHGRAVLATWRQLLDRGSLQAGEPHLAGTAKTPVAVLSPATAAGIGVVDGAKVTVRTGARRDHAAGPAGPDAGRRGLAAGELARLDGAPDARRRRRRGRGDQRR